MKKTLSIFLAVILLALVSCTNDIEAPDDSWEKVFLQYWNVMNTEYAHFDREQDLDWDDVYDTYLPLFRALDYSNAGDSMTAFSYFREIALRVDDMHYKLSVTDAFGSTLKITPAIERKWALKPDNRINNFPDIDWYYPELGLTVRRSQNSEKDGGNIIKTEDEYYDRILCDVPGANEIRELVKYKKFGKDLKSSREYDFSAVTEGTTVSDAAFYAAVASLGLSSFHYYFGIDNDGIFYFYISEFPSTVIDEPLLYKETLDDKEREQLRFSTKGDNLDKIHDFIWDKSTYDITDRIPYLKGVYELYDALRQIGEENTWTPEGGKTPYHVEGVIMDVRSNGGGDLGVMEKIFGCFLGERKQVGISRYKTGYSRYDHSPWTPVMLEYSNKEENDYSRPFAIIVNGSSASCSELSAVIVQNLMTNGAVIGAGTYGATCGLCDRNTYHSGPFTSRNLSVYTTTYETKLLTWNGSYEYLEGVGVTPDVPATAETQDYDGRYNEAVKWVKAH